MKQLLKSSHLFVYLYHRFHSRPDWPMDYFTGQVKRAEFFKSMNEKLRFERIIETGTFMGDTAEHLAKLNVPLMTVEYNPWLFRHARRRLARYPNVTCLQGDSAQALASLPGNPKERTFLYLDAHWEDRNPLREELAIAAKSWPSGVALIDDWMIPGSDLGYDPGIDESVLPSSGVYVFYPTFRAAEETGAKRGFAVVAFSPAVAEQLKTFPVLRQAIPKS